MGVRREGREAAVQFLYLSEINTDADREAYYKLRGISPSARRFCDELLDGILPRIKELDCIIRQNTKNYELHRIAAIDRNILRLATYEMLHCPELPHAAAINEAIEIAKKFSTELSGRFVNGVLDKIRLDLSKAPTG